MGAHWDTVPGWFHQCGEAGEGLQRCGPSGLPAPVGCQRFSTLAMQKDGKRTAWHGTKGTNGMNARNFDLDPRRFSNTFSDQYFLNTLCIFLYHSVGRQSDKIMAWIQAQRALDYLARANGDLKGLEAPRVSQSLRRCTLALTLRSTWNQESVDLLIDHER